MAQDKQGARKDAERETDGLIRALLDMGEALIGSGAEIYRAEDTLRRIAKAYGATDCEVFIITSSIVITLDRAGAGPRTQTRRIRRQVENGYVLASSAFTLFFSGTLADALAAGAVGAVLFALQVYVGPFCMNAVVSQFLGSFFSGILICILCRLFPSLHMARIMIGDIMLLVPGVAFTNSIRDVLLGDTLSGIVRFVEALLLAAVLTVGFLAAILLFGRIF